MQKVSADSGIAHPEATVVGRDLCLTFLLSQTRRTSFAKYEIEKNDFSVVQDPPEDRTRTG